MLPQVIASEELVSASEAAKILNKNRSIIERYQLTGQLNPISTIYPKYFFDKEEVENLKKKLDAKQKQNGK